MTADFKSHILSRDEKGFGGVPFKRLLLGGIGGGLVYTLVRFALPSLAIPVGIVFALALVVLTAPRGGLPLWLRLWLHVRGSLLLAASGQPSGIAGDLARLLRLPLALARLEAAQVFAPPAGPLDIDLREWVTYARPRDLDRGDGLVFVTAPLEDEA